jgi:hypothetical protein|tara:strand:+ start:20561 stop:20863 length:303 start_codon:yes stop_codon:yes gene_type:complete
MGYGNGMAGSKKMIRKPAIRTKMYSKEFATFYTNAISTSGDCKATVLGSFSATDGTVTFRKGYSRVRFVSDDSSIDVYLSLRNLTASVISRGAHLITFSA